MRIEDSEIKLKKCPCGEIPETLGLSGNKTNLEWAYVFGDCCGEWSVECWTNYNPLDSPEVHELAVEAWNGAPRG